MPPNSIRVVDIFICKTEDFRIWDRFNEAQACDNRGCKFCRGRSGRYFLRDVSGQCSVLKLRTALIEEAVSIGVRLAESSEGSERRPLPIARMTFATACADKNRPKP